jgi:hypothetical protein
MKQNEKEDVTEIITGSSIVGGVVKKHPLQELATLKPCNTWSEWCVMAYALNKDINKDSSLYGMSFLLGSFDERDKAETHAKNMIAKTGHSGIVVAKYGYPIPLTTNKTNVPIEEVSVDTRGNIIEMENEQFKKEKADFEKRRKIEEDMVKESEEEVKPETIDYFKRQCYLAITNKAAYEFHKSEMQKYEQAYAKRENNVREHYKAFPSHEEKWLPRLKETLTERGELNLYKHIETAYGEIRATLLSTS